MSNTVSFLVQATRFVDVRPDSLAAEVARILSVQPEQLEAIQMGESTGEVRCTACECALIHDVPAVLSASLPFPCVARSNPVLSTSSVWVCP